MRKSGTITLGIIIGVVAVIAIAFFSIVRAVLGFFGYMGPLERFHTKQKTDRALCAKYPGHDFDVDLETDWGEFGFYNNIHATDETGLRFWVRWGNDEMEDHYHDEYNEYHYGKELVEYQDSLRDRYFPHIPYVDTYEYDEYGSFLFYRGPYKEVFFESMDEAIEGSKYCAFNTDVTFKGIDLDTADDEELQLFAESIADSLMLLYDETGYYDIRINNFHYRALDENGNVNTTKEELADSVFKIVKVSRKIRKKH